MNEQKEEQKKVDPKSQKEEGKDKDDIIIHQIRIPDDMWPLDAHYMKMRY